MSDTAKLDPLLKSAVEAYVYFYPLIVSGVSYEVLTNVEKPTWETLSAPLNQFSLTPLSMYGKNYRQDGCRKLEHTDQPRTIAAGECSRLEAFFRESSGMVRQSAVFGC
jgi:hypothetical protein